jgi:hypothetical protein
MCPPARTPAAAIALRPAIAAASRARRSQRLKVKGLRQASADLFLEAHPKPPAEIGIDLDAKTRIA